MSALLRGDEVRRRVMADEKPVNPEDQVGHAAVEQEALGLGAGAGHRETGHAEEQVDDVVEDGYLEDSQEQGAGFVSRGSEGVVVGGDSGDEAQNTDEQKHCSDCLRSSLQGGLPLNGGLAFAMVDPPSVEKLPWCGALLVLGQLSRESWSVAQVGFRLL